MALRGPWRGIVLEIALWILGYFKYTIWQEGTFVVIGFSMFTSRRTSAESDSKVGSWKGAELNSERSVQKELARRAIARPRDGGVLGVEAGASRTA